MNRLIIQHPALSQAAVNAFCDALAAPPVHQSADVARWEKVQLDRALVADLAQHWQVDANLVNSQCALADFGLAAFDMDSTLITIECIDEMADYMGRKPEVAAITEAAMRGEIADFSESLRRRVALLAGMPEETLERVWHERVRLNPGVATVISTLKQAGIRTLVVSGGFTFFTGRLQKQLGLDLARSNLLEIKNGVLTGQLCGPILDAQGKRRVVEQACSLYGLSPTQAIVVGDGANDLAMMGIAGLSVAYHAKPQVRKETTHAIDHCGLDAMLNFFGS
jgi:phosphoserine phosphatase